MKLLHNFATKKCKVVTYQIFLSLTAQEAFKPLVVYQNLNSMRLLGQVPDKPWDVLFYARFRLRSLSLFLSSFVSSRHWNGVLSKTFFSTIFSTQTIGKTVWSTRSKSHEPDINTPCSNRKTEIAKLTSEFQFPFSVKIENWYQILSFVFLVDWKLKFDV